MASGSATLPSSRSTAGSHVTVRVTATIVHDGSRAGCALTVDLVATPNPVREGALVTLEAILTKGDAGLARHTHGTVRIPVTVTRGTADRGDLCRQRIAGSFSVEVRISGTHGRSTGVKNVETCHDADTDDETFTVALDEANLPLGYVAGTRKSATITIVDDDADGDGDGRPDGMPGGLTATLTATPNPVNEGGDGDGDGDAGDRRAPDGDAARRDAPAAGHRLSSEAGDHGTLSSITIPKATAAPRRRSRRGATATARTRSSR